MPRKQKKLEDINVLLKGNAEKFDYIFIDNGNIGKKTSMER